MFFLKNNPELFLIILNYLSFEDQDNFQKILIANGHYKFVANRLIRDFKNLLHISKDISPYISFEIFQICYAKNIITEKDIEKELQNKNDYEYSLLYTRNIIY